MLFDLIAYLALGLNLYSMYAKGEFKLRLFSAMANFAYIFYGILINAWPIIVGCSIAVMLHLHRLYKLKQAENIELLTK